METLGLETGLWNVCLCVIFCSQVDQVTSEVNELKRVFDGYKHRRQKAVSFTFQLRVEPLYIRIRLRIL